MPFLQKKSYTHSHIIHVTFLQLRVNIYVLFSLPPCHAACLCSKAVRCRVSVTRHQQYNTLSTPAIILFIIVFPLVRRMVIAKCNDERDQKAKPFFTSLLFAIHVYTQANVSIFLSSHYYYTLESLFEQFFFINALCRQAHRWVLFKKYIQHSSYKHEVGRLV